MLCYDNTACNAFNPGYIHAFFDSQLHNKYNAKIVYAVATHMTRNSHKGNTQLPWNTFDFCSLTIW